MSRNLLLGIAVPLLAAACGDGVPLVPVAPPDETCTFTDVTVLPADRAGPLHRMTPVAVTWRGEPDAVVFDVRSHGIPVDGEAWLDDGRAVFLPLGPLPENALIDWSVTACGTTRTGAFRTGALLHPLEDLNQCIGKPYEVDLRRATLLTPTTNTLVGDVILKWRVAPAMLLVVTDVGDDELAFYLVPGTADTNGVVAPDFNLPTQVVTGSIAENPYVALRPHDFAVAVGDGELTLRDVELLIGLGEDGFEDGRLVAEVDTRDMPATADPCAVIESLTGEKCHPCDARDEAGSCFLLEMSDLVGMRSDFPLTRPSFDHGLVVPVPCLDGDCEGAATRIEPPVTFAPGERCPDGVPCPVPPPTPVPPPRE